MADDVTTFIFVTPHRWVHTIMSIDAWRKERLAEDLWKDVRAIDGAMLEDWIEQCPAVGARIARQMLGVMPATGVYAPTNSGKTTLSVLIRL